MPTHKIRGFIGVKSNDGHDAAILVVADLLKQGGIEVIFGGYDLTAEQFAAAILQEGAHFGGISSYNGGHIPFFKAVRDRLRDMRYPRIHLIGGGGATITAADTAALENEDGIDRIFHSGEGHAIVPYLHAHYDFSAVPENPEALPDELARGSGLAVSGLLNLAEEKARLEDLLAQKRAALAIDAGGGDMERLLDAPLLENGETGRAAAARCRGYGAVLARLDALAQHHSTTVYGVTGRGGAGKSTLLDELLLRYFRDPRTARRKAAIIAVDPSAPGGGALLADRIAYRYATDKNWVDVTRIYIRSVAARGCGQGIARALPDMIRIMRAAGFDVFVETYGAGQPDAGIMGLADKPVYVATPDLGGEAQIGKEAMLNLPGVRVVLNKSELSGARRVSSLLEGKIESSRLFLATAVEHNNAGVNRLYQSLTEHYG